MDEQDKAVVEQIKKMKASFNAIFPLARQCYSDSRWLAIAETHFDEGFMALRRAIAVAS